MQQKELELILNGISEAERESGFFRVFDIRVGFRTLRKFIQKNSDSFKSQEGRELTHFLDEKIATTFLLEEELSRSARFIIKTVNKLMRNEVTEPATIVCKLQGPVVIGKIEIIN